MRSAAHVMAAPLDDTTTALHASSLLSTSALVLFPPATSTAFEGFPRLPTRQTSRDPSAHQRACTAICTWML